ncbi:hypothetical protein CEUSTIGMA_g9349.t1 [Chlamydomonas eustigma]|uniref:Protein FRA10AC1 n=1 Tax=Chlamydomonas eustigma TaxID=1157962 RepID=A0A250XFS0_9CHLO|nr:hypothetical protein CEUSTIGMA_g9349.t1 [Chlamydomonas eustigma]|eukprot:GAX81921.1 hypothetical protein CEUSTIGMA_g9349.t1 [Chlamydomonas eustigma]
MSGLNSNKRAAYDNVSKQQYYRALTAHERHVLYMKNYVQFYSGHDSMSGTDPSVLLQDTDLLALQRNHRFVRTEEDDKNISAWEIKLANRYYQKLFKEYCIVDLSRYKEHKLGLRWRIEKEVIAGKGQFICGAKRCEEKAGLCSYEVNFSYMEAGQQKQALVKLRVCPSCAFKLNYKREREFQKAPAAKLNSRRGRKIDDAEEDEDGRDLKRANLRAAEALLRQVAHGSGANSDLGLQENEDLGRASSSAPYDGTKAVRPPPSKEGTGPAQSDSGAGEGGDGGSLIQQQKSVVLMPGDDSLWEQKAPMLESATAEEDFDQYFEGLFL